MKRRNFLIGSAGLMYAKGSAFAQVDGSDRMAAVVIGVDNCGDLTPLKAAASGARRMEAWLRDLGYEVTVITDENGNLVTANTIFDQVRTYVDDTNTSQLLIYFSGHGILLGKSEVLFLTNAKEDATEAINLESSLDLASKCGVPNIIFISDACRSLPKDVLTNSISGRPIFPLRQVDAPVDIDRFYATAPGVAAVEFDLDTSVRNFQGIYTDTLLTAFTSPTQDLVDKLPDGRSVITKIKLGEYLAREVPKRVQKKGLRLSQKPQALIYGQAPPHHFFGNIYPRDQIIVAGPAVPATSVTVQDVVSVELENIGIGSVVDSVAIPADLVGEKSLVQARYGQQLDAVANESGFARSLNQLSIRKISSDFPDQQQTCSIELTGSKISEFALPEGIQGSLEGYQQLFVDLRDLSGCSVAIRFADGSGTVVAAIRDHRSVVTLSDGVVLDVSYDSRFEDQFSKQRLAAIRATVAAANEQGLFRFEGNFEERNRKAERFADQVRTGKSDDPTLGIYAAYAYTSAGLSKKARSVDDFMRSDLGISVFDVYLLSRPIAENGEFVDRNVVPFCPMMTQGWNYLQTRGIKVPEVVERARRYLLPSPWTAFSREGMDILMAELWAGRLK